MQPETRPIFLYSFSASTSIFCILFFKYESKFSPRPVFYQKRWARTWKVVGGTTGEQGAGAGPTGRPCPLWCPSTVATARTRSTQAATRTRVLASTCSSLTTHTACGARKRSTTGSTTPDDTSSAASVLMPTRQRLHFDLSRNLFPTDANISLVFV